MDRNVWGLVLFWILAVVVGFVGWVMNIVKLTESEWATEAGMMILRGIGIVLAPLGAILGYFV